jgi:uncharacterized protein (TIGR02145 family)
MKETSPTRPITSTLLVLSAFLLCATELASAKGPKINESTHAMRVAAGWNLLSLPASVGNGSRAFLFPSALSPAFVFRYPVGYHPQDTLQNGTGFWLKFASADTVLIPGNTSLVDTIQVQGGWNLIGSLTMPIAISAVKTEPTGIITSQFFGYVSGVGYHQADTLYPGHGYWVKMNQSGSVILSDPSSTSAAVTVDTSEIGGSSLRLVSCFEEGDPSSNDTLAVRVSKKGNQLLFAVDGENSLRALTLSTPRDSAVDVLRIDAHSTAAAMIFMSPGISTTDSNEFLSTLSNITSLPGFFALEEYLRQRLHATSINQIVLDPLCDSLLTKCLVQYSESYPLSSEFEMFRRVMEERNHFELIQTTNGGQTQLDMANEGWRYVNVVRRDLGQGGSLLGNTMLVENMGGAVPSSWGCIFTWSCFAPTIAGSQFSLPANVAASDVWVIGTGWPPSNDVPPSDIQSIEKPWLPSLLNYVAFPILDLFTGTSEFLEKPPSWVIQASDVIEAEDPAISFVALDSATTPEDRAGEAVELTRSMISAGAATGVITGPAAALAAELAAGTIVLSPANLIVWAMASAADEPYSRFQLDLRRSCPGTPTVTYAGKTYNTVQIGSQCWLRENLDVGTMVLGSQEQTDNDTIEKYCYGDSTVNCDTYGGLYQWKEAMQYDTTQGVRGICPAGWHIPTLAEFQTLSTTVGGDGNALKAIGQGTGGGIGTNTSGFSALLAGYLEGYGAVRFIHLADSAIVWSSTLHDATRPHNLNLVTWFSNISLYYYYWREDFGFSVRCIKD